MSESDDDNDLGGLLPTTPVIRVKKGNLARNSKPNSRAEPGPSTKPKGGRKNATSPLSENSDIEELPPNHLVENEKPQPPKAVRKPASRIDVPVTNGKATAKGKGKAKAPPMKSSRKPVVEPMDVEPIEIVDDTEMEQDIPADAETINTAGRYRRTNATGTRAAKADDLQRVTEKLRRAEEQIAALSRQLEEAFQVRETEAEELLKRQETQFEAQLQAQERLIKELTSQLALKEPLMRSGKTSVLHLLTREAADEEKRTLEKEVTRWKDVATERQKTIDEKDGRIAELEKTEKDLQVELKAEIDRTALLAARPNRNLPSVVRSGRPGGGDDPRHAAVLRFYEDLTNLLVTNMKPSSGKYLDMEEWLFSCIYTHNGADEDGNKKSLNFTLRTCHDPAPDTAEPITSKTQLIPSIHYIPLELDKEPPDFVARLDFLGAPFTFGLDQLPLFLRTMHTNMGNALEDDESDGDSVQLVE
ncbi:hypothetical protein Hypma_011820 [Hypsizygus marmoreus]|uniref:Monopolin complex subunit Csm1/Pcs1 C-terminal domain-containing protein n=1 Tax=Hypsizygus marmoreus TaxID=39966 RepID=A0A369JFQ3_HYPMA|nr:hypothetical protein Hypma_011820 [Hypsizygus marmoreus]